MMRFKMAVWSDGSGRTGIHYGDVDLGQEIEAWLGEHCRSTWFMEHHARHLTAEFFAWWTTFYGSNPPPFDAEPCGHADYFLRMAYALYGWRACANQPLVVRVLKEND